MDKFVGEISVLDDIVKKTVKVIDNSRNQIYDIAENCRQESKRLEEELEHLEIEAERLAEYLKIQERELSAAKKKLLDVSKNYSSHSEENIKQAYETADKLRVDVIVSREKEKNVLKRRNEMQLRLNRSVGILEKADKLVNQVGIAMNFLNGNLQDLSVQLEGIKSRQVYALRILKAQEEERHRVARDIHDGPAQIMANVILKAELCDKLINIDVNKSKVELQNLKDIVRDSLKDIRRIIYDLRPMSLDDLGLITTLERYTSSFKHENNVDVVFNVSGEEKELNSMVSLTIFRIFQEVFNNIKKYSKAKNVKVVFYYDKEVVNFKIEDDGVGFESNNINKQDSDNIDKGFGISSMRERVKLLEGKFTISSRIGSGTKVIVTLPYIK